VTGAIMETMDPTLLPQTTGVTAQSAVLTPADAALQGNTLGVGFSGSGLLVRQLQARTQ
jgi:hypothetical protein